MNMANDHFKKKRIICIKTLVNAVKKLRFIIHFIPSSEFNTYLKQIKVILSVVKKYRIFSLLTNTIYIFFTVANTGCFDNLGLNFFQKRFLSDIALRKYARQIK